MGNRSSTTSFPDFVANLSPRMDSLHKPIAWEAQLSSHVREKIKNRPKKTTGNGSKSRGQTKERKKEKGKRKKEKM